MLRLEVRDQACRGCQMCVDICPTKVFDFDADAKRPTIRDARDCIACLSCAFLCPSGAITHADYPVVKNFYRDLEFVDRVERFL